MISTPTIDIEGEHVFRCVGLNSAVSATDSQLIIKPTLPFGGNLTIPFSDVLSIRLEARSIIPPLTIALVSLVGVGAIWGHAGNWSWPIRLREGFDSVFSWALLLVAIGFADVAFRSLFASIRLDTRNLGSIVIRTARRDSAMRFVEKFSSLRRL